MPELPEVETLVFELKSVLEGRELRGVEIRNESLLETPRARLEEKLPGKKIVHIGRLGKYIRFELSEGFILWFHLGMTGQLFFQDPPSVLPPHTHFVLSFSDTPKRLFYRDVRRFGRIALTPWLTRWIRPLGPEPKEWDKEAFASCMKERQARIKNLLLDQRLVSGLGNIYADESLHRAGIHPLRRAHRVPLRRLVRLHEAICEVLDEAIAWGGSSIDDYLHLDGSRGRFQRFHRVYGRTGENCFSCGSRIRRIRLSGRSSAYCPGCQR